MTTIDRIGSQQTKSVKKTKKNYNMTLLRPTLSKCSYLMCLSLYDLRSIRRTLIEYCLSFEGRPPANNIRRHDIYLVTYILTLMT